MSESESRLLKQKQLVERLRNESEQLKVDLSYARANSENQQLAYDKL